MKVLVTPTSFQSEDNQEAREMLEAFADEIQYNDLQKPFHEEEIIQRLEGVDAYLAGLDYITEKVIQAAPPGLRVISRYGAGVDRVDLAAAKARNICITNTPGTNAVAVAEMAMGLMFSAARKIPQMHQSVQAGEWPRFRGMQIRGKRLGIIGFGAIGQELARCAAAVGMEVVACDPYFSWEVAAQLGVEELPMDDILKTADFVSLHLPLNEATRHCIEKEKIQIMKDGAVLINTSRGGIIRETDAIMALMSGKLACLCLDVYEQEPPTGSKLLQLPNVILTPHAGAHTKEAVAAMGLLAVKNLIAVMENRDCPYCIN